LALGLLTLLTFARVVGHGFLVWDDRLNITENPLLVPWTSGNWLRFWQGSYARLYIPLTYSWFAGMTWLSQWTNGGPDPRLFHAGNLLLHLANVGLVCWLLKRLSKNWLAAGAGAALFAVHPLATESVAWVTETKGLLSASFGLVSLHALVSAAQINPAKDRSPAWQWLGAGTLALVAALLAKPAAAAIPLVGLVILCGPLQVNWRRAVAMLVPWFVVVAGFAISTRQLQAEQLQFVPPAWWLRPWIALDAIGFYLSKLFWPVGLAADYARTPDVVRAEGLANFWWILFIVAIGAWFARRQSAGLVGLAIFVAALAPVLGLVPFGYQHVSTVADRYAYLALLGPAYVVTDWVARGGVGRLWICVPVAAVLAALSLRQTGLWQDDETLFRGTLAITPQSSVAHNNLAFHLLERRALDEALPLAREAVRLRPTDEKARITLGAILLEQGAFSDSIAELSQAIELGGGTVAQGNLLLARLKLGQQQLQRGDVAAAEREFRAALMLDNQASAAWAGLGGIATLNKNWHEGQNHLKKAIELAPQVPEHHYNLGQVLLQDGKPAEAAAEFAKATVLAPQMIVAWQGWIRALLQDQQAVEAEQVAMNGLAANAQDASLIVDLARLSGRRRDFAGAVAQLQEGLAAHPESILVLNELAWSLATCPEATVRQPSEAVKLGERLCALSERAETLDTLAAAYASAGDFERATATAERALELIEDRGSAAATSVQGRLELYRAGKPYVEEIAPQPN